MKTFEKKKALNSSYDMYMFFLILSLIFFHIVCNINIRSISFSTDEFIPVGIAAHFAGLDWSHARTFDYYYGYVTLLFFIPLFKIPAIYQNSYLLTQTLLGINSVFHIVMAIFLYKTLCLFHPENDKRRNNFIITIISVCLLQVFNVSLGCQIESLFCLSFVISFFILCRISKGKGKNYEAIILALFSFIAYANNSRGLVLIVSTVITFIIIMIADKKIWKIFLIYILSIIFLLLIHEIFIYPKYIKFFESGAKNTSNSSLIEKIKLILTNTQYLKVFLITIMGWFTACIISTFGFFIIPFSSVFMDALKNGGRKDLKAMAIPVFAILSFVGTLLLCTVNSLNTNFNLLVLQEGDRADLLFYVRYLSSSLPIIMALGLDIWINEKETEHIRKLSLFSLISTILLGLIFLLLIIIPMNGFQYATNNSTFLALFLKNFKNNFRYGIVDVGNYLVVFGITLVIVSLVACISQCHRNNKKIMYALLFSQIFLCIFYVNGIASGKGEYYATYFGTEVINYCNSSNAETIYISSEAPTGQYQMPDKIVYDTFEYQDMAIISKNNSKIEGLENYVLTLQTDKWLVYERAK